MSDSLHSGFERSWGGGCSVLFLQRWVAGEAVSWAWQAASDPAAAVKSPPAES